MAVRAVRGATVAAENTKEEIFNAAEELINEILKRGNINIGDIIDIIFTVTPDLTAAFPAAAVRRMGITDVPLLDMAAPDVDGALKMCIRVMVHINTELDNSALNHVYLRGAATLRPDLAPAKKISVAIDGPAGAGKSTAAKKAAAELGYVYIDTGAMYRTVALYAIERGMDPSKDISRLTAALDDIKIEIKYVGGVQHMFLNGADVSARIRENDVSMGASAVAVNPAVRRYLVAIQREMASGGGVIMDGRDIASAVLPDAELKIYLTASADERAMRRYREYLEKGVECDFEAIKSDIIKRDENDMNRAVSPLKKAEDAILLDTTDKTFDETVAILKEMIKTTEKK